MADKERIKNAADSAVSKVCDKNGKEFALNSPCRSAREDAHRSRNQFQENTCPTNLSETGGGLDENTGIEWTKDKGSIFPIWLYTQTYKGWHEGETCYRGKPTRRQTRAIKNNSEFKRNVRILGGNSRKTSPGYQCCYKSDGSLSPSSSFDYDSDYSGGDHEKLDMDTHDEFEKKPDGTKYKYGGYDDYEMSSGKSVDYPKVVDYPQDVEEESPW